MINIAFEYCGKKLFICSSKYDNERLALVIYPTPNTRGAAYCVLTVNLPKKHLEEGEFFVKTWSENEVITNFLRKSGIFEDTGKRVLTGFVEAEVWKFKEEEEETIESETKTLHRR